MHLHFCSCSLWTCFHPPHTCYCWLVLETCVRGQLALWCPSALSSLTLRFATHHTTHPPLHACLAMAIRQKFNNVPWQKLCRRTKTGPWHVCAFWEMQWKYALSLSLSKIFLSQRLFQRPKIGTRHVYVFSNMQWHSSLAFLCKNSHNRERVKWLTPANCVVRYSPRFVHAYALAGDSALQRVPKCVKIACTRMQWCVADVLY